MMTTIGAPEFEADVVVCGGGCAGLGAALAAARGGARTLLIERAPFAGGIITTVGLPFFDGIADPHERRIVVRGIPFELLVEMGVCTPETTHLPTYNPTIDSIERFKLLTDRLLRETPNLSVLFDSLACEVETSGDRIERVIVANKAGLCGVRAGTMIDCTGDADVAARSGAPTEKRDELQPMTMHFRIGNVRPTATLKDDCKAAVVRAHERGDVPMFYGPGFRFNFAPDEIYVHAVRVPGDGSDPVDMTRAQMQGRADAWAIYQCWKRDVPGFEDAYYISSGPWIGVRETRRIVGQYVLTEDDILANRSFDDVVVTGCWDIDQHPNDTTVGYAQHQLRVLPQPYDIPYRSLLPRQVENLLVAGRCHSATQIAASSTRVTATAMALGEAAGTAAALATTRGTSVQELSPSLLQDELARRGAGPLRAGAAVT
jgi:hypothetical protein